MNFHKDYYVSLVCKLGSKETDVAAFMQLQNNCREQAKTVC